MSWFWGSSKKSNDESSEDEEGSYDDESSYETDSEAESLDDEGGEDGDGEEEMDQESYASEGLEEDSDGGDEELSFLKAKETARDEGAGVPVPETNDGKAGSSSSEASTIEDPMESVGSPKGGSMATTISNDLTDEADTNENAVPNNGQQSNADNSSDRNEDPEDLEGNPQDDEKKEDADADSQRALGECGFAISNDNPQEDATGMILSQTASEEDDQELGELVLQGAIPGEVVGNRDRAPSGVTFDDDNTSHDDQETLESGDLSVELESDHEEEDDSDDDDKPEGTSLQDKQSLLVLAAEHDRVDILNNLLQECGDNNPELKQTLLQGGLPPLHVAVLCGSMNALNCLLRVGADPSFRPTLQNLPQEQTKAVSNTSLMDGKSAWELVSLVKLAKAKQEGIQHAFCAEALRCIGSDEDDRLKQLLDAGVSPELTVGDKTLKDWSIEMKAPLCQKLLGVLPQVETELPATAVPVSTQADARESNPTKRSSAVLDRQQGEESVSSLSNRLEELESLARALSACLDNLGEETSVCTGLLLIGGGASALATHVRSLKTTKEQKIDELERLREAHENSQDELAYWVREMGSEGEAIAKSMTVVPPTPLQSEVSEDQDRTRQMLQAQIAASEVKVRKLRASIGDLSEESARNLAEVERRGLTGGIQLVRNLRDELREIEFEISQLKMEDATCHAKIHLIQTKMNAKKAESAKDRVDHNVEEDSEQDLSTVDLHAHPSEPHKERVNPEKVIEVEIPLDSKHTENGTAHILADEKLESGGNPISSENEQKDQSPVPVTVEPSIEVEEQPVNVEKKPTKVEEQPIKATSPNPVTPIVQPRSISVEKDSKPTVEPSTTKESQKIAMGESTALALRGEGHRGFLPLNIWQILLRIIGVRPEAAPSSGRSNSTRRSRDSQPAVIL